MIILAIEIEPILKFNNSYPFLFLFTELGFPFKWKTRIYADQIVVHPCIKYFSDEHNNYTRVRGNILAVVENDFIIGLVHAGRLRKIYDSRYHWIKIQLPRNVHIFITEEDVPHIRFNEPYHGETSLYQLNPFYN